MENTMARPTQDKDRLGYVTSDMSYSRDPIKLNVRHN